MNESLCIAGGIKAVVTFDQNDSVSGCMRLRETLYLALVLLDNSLKAGEH
jgi:hypothetical protein